MAWPWYVLKGHIGIMETIENVKEKRDHTKKRVHEASTCSLKNNYKVHNHRPISQVKNLNFARTQKFPQCPCFSPPHSLPWAQEDIILDSSKSFIILPFTFRIIINAEQIFGYEMRYIANIFFSHLDPQLPHIHHLLKSLSSVCCINQLSVYKSWIYLSGFKETPYEFVH